VDVRDGFTDTGNARGYRTVILMPETQSQEKKDMLLLCGVELRCVPAVPYKNDDHYVKQAERLAAELAKSEPRGVLYANQWDNPSNRNGHLRSTGPEIWTQTDGQVDGFTCAIGTGGTLAGVGEFLKSRNSDVRIVAADPMGANMYHWIKDGELRGEGSSITEGIGQGRVTGNVEGAPIDDAYQIPDTEMLPIVFDLLSEEGLCLGGSSGINVAGAIRLAKELGPGHTVVTVLCDGGTRYQSKLFNPEFLRSKDLPVPSWLE
jgi:cysteine synthase A